MIVMGTTATGILAIGLGAGAQRLIVKQDTYLATTGGSVGIGTTAPKARLSITGDGAGTANIGGGFCGADWTGISLNGQVGNCGVYNVLSSPSNPELLLNRPAGHGIRFRENNVDQVYIAPGGNLGLGATSAPVELTLNGPAASIAGPHIEAIASQDAYPVFQALNWSHDNISLNFDRYFNGSTWVSSSSTGSFAIYKYGGMLVIKAGSAAAGAAVPSNVAIAVTSAGDVGIGTTTPSYKLHVNGTAAGTSWTNLSSRDFKDDVRYIDASEYDKMLARVVAMKPARYRYKSAYTDDQSVHLGFIAEEMPKEVLSPNGKGVDTYELVTYLAGAVKAQQQEIAELRALIRQHAKR
jgi:hypothetical protein